MTRAVLFASLSGVGLQENGGVSGKRVEATLQRDFEGFFFKGKERNKTMFEGGVRSRVFKIYGRKMRSLWDCLNRTEKHHDAGGGGDLPEGCP